MIRILRWDICAHFHGMSDFGHAPGGGYSRSRTYTGECYEHDDRREKARCRRLGRCVIAVLAKPPDERKAREVTR